MKTVKDVESALVTLGNFPVDPMILKSTIKESTPEEIRKKIDKMKKNLSNPLLESWGKLQNLCQASGKIIIKKGIIDFPDHNRILSNTEETALNELLDQIEDTPNSIVV